MTVKLSMTETHSLLKIPSNNTKLQEYLEDNNYKSLHYEINSNRIVGEFTLGNKTYKVDHTGNSQYVEYARYRGIHLSITEIEPPLSIKNISKQSSDTYSW